MKKVLSKEQTKVLVLILEYLKELYLLKLDKMMEIQFINDDGNYTSEFVDIEWTLRWIVNVIKVDGFSEFIVPEAKYGNFPYLIKRLNLLRTYYMHRLEKDYK